MNTTLLKSKQTSKPQFLTSRKSFSLSAITLGLFFALGHTSAWADEASMQKEINDLKTQLKTLQQYIKANAGDTAGDATASDGAVAVGNKANAARNSVAVGNNANASVTQSVAIGYNTTASGFYATAIGVDSNATKQSALALGYNSNANGTNSVSVGSASQANATSTVAIGYRTEANANNSIAIGSYVDATGNRNYITRSSGERAVAIGPGANATASNTIALGYITNATGTNAIAIGSKATASGNNTFALGDGAQAIGESSFAMGSDAQSLGRVTIAIGNNNRAYGSYSMVIGSGSVAGTDNGGDYALALGSATFARAKDATALGFGANAGGEIATSVGRLAVATGNLATAVGGWANAIADQTFAAGYKTKVNGKASTAVGAKSTVDAENVAAVGYNTTVDASSHQAAVLGSFTNVTNSLNSIVIGSQAGATNAYGGIALGYGATTTITDGVALGSLSTTSVKEGQLGYDANTGKAITLVDAIGQENVDKYNKALSELKTLQSEQAGQADINAKQAEADKLVSVWQSTSGAVSVGNAERGITRQITNVAAGTQDTDAVNVAQLKRVNTKVNSILNGEAGTVVYTDDKGNRLVKANDGKYYQAGAVNEDGTVKTAEQAGEGVSVAAVDKPQISLVNSDSTTTTATKLSNVADGAISATSKDAINGSQLHDANQKIAEIIGGGATVDGNGKLTNPTYTITNADGSTTTSNSIGDALSKLDKTNADQNDSIKKLGDQITNTVNNSKTELTDLGLKFAGNDNAVISRKLGETLNIQGVNAVYSSAGYEATNYSLDNLITYKDGDTTLRIAMKNNPTFKGLTLDDGTNSVNLKPGADGTLTANDKTVVTEGNFKTIFDKYYKFDQGFKTDGGGSSSGGTSGGSSGGSTAGGGTSGGQTTITVDKDAVKEMLKDYVINAKEVNTGNSKMNNDGFSTKDGSGKSTTVDAGGLTAKDGDKTVSVNTNDGVTVKNGDKSSSMTEDGLNVKNGDKSTSITDSGVNVKNGDKSTSVNESGVTIKNGSNTVSVTENGLDNGGNRITNVADGVNPNDAVNVSQLQRNNQAVNQAIASNRDDIARLDRKTQHMTKEYRAGIAGAMAMSQIYPVPGKTYTVGAAVGSFKGQTAVAVGLRAQPKPNVVLSLTGSGDSNSNVGIAGGVSFGFK